jgi:hypothetical protein
MMESCGHLLYEVADPPPSVVPRLQALWDWRVRELTAGRTQPEELAGFGWWLASVSIPPEWALSRLEGLIAAGGSPGPSHIVANRLADLRLDHMPAIVRCTALLIDAPTDPWFIDTSRDEISAVLADGLAANDAQTRQVASEAVSRLVARGRTSFAQLLS